MPKVFLILGLCYALMQLIGILLITEPNEEEQKQLVSETETSLVTTQSTKKSLTMKEAQDIQILGDLGHLIVRIHDEYFRFFLL